MLPVWSFLNGCVKESMRILRVKLTCGARSMAAIVPAAGDAAACACLWRTCMAALAGLMGLLALLQASRWWAWSSRPRTPRTSSDVRLHAPLLDAVSCLLGRVSSCMHACMHARLLRAALRFFL